MKITYHIPLYYENQGKLITTYSSDFRAECLQTLHKLGVSHIQLHTIKVKRLDKFIEEELLIFWSDDLGYFSNLFIELVTKYHSDLCQQEYFYEFDSNLVSIKGELK